MTLSALVASALGPEESTSRVHAAEGDAVLTAALRGGDDAAARAAIEMLFVRLSAPLARFARRVGAGDLADDVVTDVFASLWMRRTTLSVSFRPEPYLYRAARNRALQLMRGDARAHRKAIAAAAHIDIDADVNGYNRDDHDDRTAIIVMVRKAVDTLPESQRTALTLRLTHGMALADVAEAMELSVPAVKMVLQRALKRLRRLLAPMLDGMHD